MTRPRYVGEWPDGMANDGVVPLAAAGVYDSPGRDVKEGPEPQQDDGEWDEHSR